MASPMDSEIAYPEVFTTVPQQPVNLKDGMFNDEQIRQFFAEGFVVVNNFFKSEELQPARDSIKREVEALAQKLYKAGKITDLYKQYGLFQRLTKINDEFPGSAIILHKIAHIPEGIRKLWANERLLNVAEQLLDSKDIVGHPVWNLRTKVPKVEAVTVPWHQDSGYLDDSSYSVLQVTAWIPLLDTNATNGCMQFMRRGHRKGQIATHTCCHGNTWYITLGEDQMKNSLDIDVENDVVTVPVPYGGAVFFNNMIPHRSLNNTSNDIRWSLDLRWQRADKPVGFYGIKEGILMRSSTEPDLVVDWAGFESVDRQTADKLTDVEEKDTDDFDITIWGPWMKKWQLVNHNIHTQRFLKDEQ